MGQSSSREKNLEEHIVASIRKQFESATQGSRTMDKDCFKMMTSQFLDPRLQDIIFDSLKEQKEDTEVLTEDNFVRIAEIALGGYELQGEGIYMSNKPLQEIVEAIVASFFICEECETTPSTRGLLVEHILVNAPHSRSSAEAIAHWLAGVNTFPTIIRRISRKLCLGYYIKIMPDLKGVTCLTPAALAVLTLHLPYERRDDWTLLYASSQHGLSFVTLVASVDGAGPCLIVIETESGRVFGGFANEGFQTGLWHRGGYGCFLFEDRTILNVYHATGYDTRFAYLCNIGSYPKGIAMGGGMTDWSFFVPDDMDKGTSTPNIATFDKCWLAGEYVFTVKNIEVWRIGPPRQRKRYDSTGSEIIWGSLSALERDPGAVAILELSGKGMVGEASRDLQRSPPRM